MRKKTDDDDEYSDDEDDASDSSDGSSRMEFTRKKSSNSNEGLNPSREEQDLLDELEKVDPRGYFLGQSEEFGTTGDDGNGAREEEGDDMDTEEKEEIFLGTERGGCLPTIKRTNSLN